MTKRLQFHRYQDKTMNAALVYLYARTIRDGLDGLGHVEALLRLRGIDPNALRVPVKQPRHFKRRELSSLVLDAIKEGPKTGPQLYDLAQARAPLLTRKEAAQKVRAVLVRLNGRGVVVRDGKVWNLRAQGFEFQKMNGRHLDARSDIQI